MASRFLRFRRFFSILTARMVFDLLSRRTARNGCGKVLPSAYQWEKFDVEQGGQRTGEAARH